MWWKRVDLQELSKPGRLVSGEPYPEWVQQMAFAQFVLADRNASAAQRGLVAQWDETWGDPPDTKTVQRWARLDNWEYRADVLISEQYPALYQRDIARMIALRGKAISTYSELLAGTYKGSQPMAAAQVARHTIDLTLGGMSVQAPRADGAIEEDLSTEERASRQRERLERGRGSSRDWQPATRQKNHGS